MSRNMGEKEFEDIFRKFSVNIQIFPQGAKTKGANYDPFRKTSFVESFQNPLPVKALLKPVSANSLIYRDLGLVQAGAIQILIKNPDISIVELSDKCEIQGKTYYAYNKAVGNRVQIFPSQFSGYSKVILFRSKD